jgi:hypothetical protein
VQAYGSSLDNWVKENKHVLQLIHEDAKNAAGTGGGATSTVSSNKDVVEGDKATEEHKAIVGERRPPIMQTRQ